jgi:DNA repair and recombination protein RAD52
MSFTEEQITALKAPLNRAFVKERSQAGRSLSYIEGWKAIDEANRIFGFDNWERQTVELKPVCEPYQDPSGKWRVSYMARVRIHIKSEDIVRDGCGYGSGIDKDLGQAHESALKEAETDAMKRALMTFGNPFGLALYDKEQKNVVDEVQAEAIAYVSLAKTALQNATTDAELTDWWKAESGKRREYGIIQGAALYDELVAAVQAHKASLSYNKKDAA